MNDINRLASIEDQWSALEASYRLDACFAPINQADERSKMIAAHQESRNYNPQFSYAAVPDFPTTRMVAFMAHLQPDTSKIERLYFQKAQGELLGFQAIQSRSPDAITGYACYAFGLPTPDALEAALEILMQPKPVPSDSSSNDINAEDAATFLQKGLVSLGLGTWSAVVFEPMNARVSVNRLDRQVRIRRGTSFSQEDLRRLLVHEIGVHVVRFENGCLQSLGLFSSTFPRYMATEEGIAVYSEQSAGLLQNSTFRVYAGRVLAAYLSLTSSFSQVFSRLTEFFEPEMAFEICARAKRGFLNTSLFGAHTKDIAYLTGFLDVSRHLKNHPEHYELLFSGKFGLEQLDMVLELKESGELSTPKYLPKDLG